MPQAVSFSGANGRTGTYVPDATSSVGLRAKLDRYEKQLSDCVNCASAKTPEGKADIAAISAKIDEVKRTIAGTSNGEGRAASRNEDQAVAVASSMSPLGNCIDTYA
ncbi:hypothetical protein HAV22_21875 [Massilia sp. TW-1]|uniref:Uncharacterized protein n=1 Tax=Telluria antibiotica TaxID=2717319 RepID=A0ABX0PHJ3_9BURK|nr:hypothetical protein [Telluria antibiotica]NIA56282.1 hypothetical protein [Telluria antibiotica]